MAQFFRHYLLAVQYFTRLPVTGRLATWVGYSPAMMAACTAHFPGVGALLGLLLAGAALLGVEVLPWTHYTPLLVACLVTVFGLLLTGGLHEDGLGDVADGLGGGSTRERALEIMKDSRMGAFGVLAIGMALLLRVALLAMLGALGLAPLCMGLLLGAVFSRNYALWVIRVLPNVGAVQTSKSRSLAQDMPLSRLVVAFGWCVLALGGALLAHDGMLQWSPASAAQWGAMEDNQWWSALGLAASLSLLAWWWMVRWFDQRLQGFTGDCLGATQQVCELTFYLGLIIGWGLMP